MLTQSERDNLEKIMDMMKMAGFAILAMHLYIYCFPIFYKFGMYHPSAESFLKNLAKALPPFGSKIFAVIMLLAGCFGTRGKKDQKVEMRDVLVYMIAGSAFYFGSLVLYFKPEYFNKFLWAQGLYMLLSVVGFVMILTAGSYASRLFTSNIGKDIFNDESETFPQEEMLIENEYSVNFRTTYQLKKRIRNGWVNVVNPFRGSMVLGTPGSGKSFAILIPAIKQSIRKNFAAYIYDFKFPDLTEEAYNEVLRSYNHLDEPKPQFYVINFDDPYKSHRCNPLDAKMMTDILDAYEAASTIMLNLNKTWIKKQGDFFVESPINFVAGIIWFLKLFQNGKYCTFPHVIEFMGRSYDEMFPILGSYPEIENLIKPFVSAYEGGAMEQLEGQIASARIPLSRLASPQLYWIMSDNDFTLDINNPDEPKILCIGNNPDRQAIYGAALGLYNARIIKLINKKGKRKCGVFIDELPTIYFKGLDNLIATARSNKVATYLGFQDFSQLERDYGKEEAMVIRNTLGNVFSGQVVSETAKDLQERFGKINQIKETVTESRSDTSHATSTQLDYMIPAGKISNLSQGNFVGAVADNVGENIKLKVFHAKVEVDMEEIKQEQASFQKLPIINDFKDEQGNDRLEEIIKANYQKVKDDIIFMVRDELRRIANDPNLRHLLRG